MFYWINTLWLPFMAGTRPAMNEKVAIADPLSFVAGLDLARPGHPRTSARTLAAFVQVWARLRVAFRADLDLPPSARP